jgi:uncharacterized protein YjbI with pentapeptide repeats
MLFSWSRLTISLSDSNFDGADFTNAIVDRASFTGSSLRGTIFTNAVLTGTSFNGADVENADFTDAYIGGTYLCVDAEKPARYRPILTPFCYRL